MNVQLQPAAEDVSESSALYRLRHSATHVMAQAVVELFPDARLGIGPPIEHGFYYDFELPRALTPDDLQAIEAGMRRIIAEDWPLLYRRVEPDEARELFRSQPYKLELIDGLERAGEQISTFRQDGFEDLCRGPHLERTGQIPADGLRLLNVSGAYWRGDERRPMLQRINGTAWYSADDLERYLWQREEAEKRDHRRLGRELELFHFDPSAPGMAYWLPRGVKLLNTLIAFWREEHERRGYQEIASPLLNDRRLWELSGHWDHYRENMFLVPVDEHTTYSLKPMNCPNAMIVYNLKPRSYRDLPLRLADCDILHRDERSGTLHGLLRAQKFQQDDAHIFLPEEQIEEEYDRILDLTDRYYSIFDLKYSFRLGTRPDDFIGEVATWNRAEAALTRILDRHVGAQGYSVAEGDGAFYGPKIDILMEDALGRSWQMGTIQLDFQLPERFGCTYDAQDGSRRTPVVIHHVIYGSLERFIGILIEHTAGALPVWLAPLQAAIIPISAEKHGAYAREAAACLRAHGLRIEVDEGRERMQAKIRTAQLQKVPYMLIVGDRELATGTVAVRLRSGEDLGSMPVEDFLARAASDIENKRLQPLTPASQPAGERSPRLSR